MWKKIRNGIKDGKSLKWIYAQSRGQVRNIILLIVGDIVMSLMALAFSFASAVAIDKMIYEGDTRFFLYGGMLIGITLIQLLLRIVIGYGGTYIRNRLVVHSRTRFLDKVLHKKYSQISRYHSGELMTYLFSDVNIVVEGVTGMLPNVILTVSELGFAVVALCIFDMRLALLYIVCGSGIMVASKLFRKYMKHMHHDIQEKSARTRSRLQETIEKILIIRIFQKEPEILERNDILQQEHFHAQMIQRRFSMTVGSGFSLLFKVSYVVALVWGATHIAIGEMTYGSLVAILQLVGIIQAPLGEMSGMLSQFYRVITSAERIMEIENLEDEDSGSFLPLERERVRASLGKELQGLSIENITFAYDEDSVLNHASGTIQVGDRIAITGTSGCGKSTLFLLMLGIYQADKGKITFTVGDQALQPGRETRSLFSYVPQGNALFSGTIRENICFMNERSEEEIQLALELACVDDFIQSLPDGLETVIGENALGVSEGQAQRLAIARAFLERASIILLDEATSALDAQTEEKILQNIKRAEYKICLFVTHRRTVLDICNKEWVITKQGITEYELG